MKYYNDNDEDKSRSESDARDDGYIAVFVGSIITISIIAIFVYVFSSIDSNKSTLKPVGNVEVSEPVQEIPKEPEITFANFEDFGITFDEFVQEYNNSSVGQEYPIIYFGIPSKSSYAEKDKICHELALRYTGVASNVYDNPFNFDIRDRVDEVRDYIFRHSNTTYEKKGDVTEFHFSKSVGVFIRTKGESYNVFEISVLGNYNSKIFGGDFSNFSEELRMQETIFPLMSEILLKKMETRGVSQRIIANTKTKIKEYSNLDISYSGASWRYCFVHLSFSLKNGVEVEYHPHL